CSFPAAGAYALLALPAVVLSSLLRRPPTSTLFPYTTLFRSDPTRRGTTPPPAAPPRTRRRAGRRRSRRRPPRPGGRPRPPRPPPWPRPPRSRPLHHSLEQPHRQPGIVVPGVGVRRPGATHLLRVERRLQQRLALLRPPGQDAAIRAHDQRPARERHGALDTRTVGQHHVDTVELGRHPRHALPHVRRGEPATGLASLEHAPARRRRHDHDQVDTRRRQNVRQRRVPEIFA